DQKKHESSFIRALRHLLPKKYSYTIVSDRGFGNDRFAELCADKGFDYVLRVNENLNVRIGDKVCNLSDFKGKNEKFSAYVFAWEKEVEFEVHTENESTRFLMASKPDISGREIYKKRFSIEKCFQDQKSSGFNIEKCKIRKYDRFKRLYFAMCLAQLFVVMIGEYIENENHPLKKRFRILVGAISAFSNSDGMLARRYLVK
ncbi:MAG: transposase, partial [Holosporaceae bacterium]|nr:transposase [Holosporaceae bacterium]